MECFLPSKPLVLKIAEVIFVNNTLLCFRNVNAIRSKLVSIKLPIIILMPHVLHLTSEEMGFVMMQTIFPHVILTVEIVAGEGKTGMSSALNADARTNHKFECFLVLILL